MSQLEPFLKFVRNGEKVALKLDRDLYFFEIQALDPFRTENSPPCWLMGGHIQAIESIDEEKVWPLIRNFRNQVS